MSSNGSVSLLIGKTLVDIEEHNGEEMTFVCDDGEAFRAYHMQDCCERVRIHDVGGNLDELCGSPIVAATEEAVQDEWPSDVPVPEFVDDSYTWTTHTITNAAGVTVRIRCLGESNGYYGESVYFTRTHAPMQIKKKKESP